MDLYLISVLIFVVILAVLVYKDRKKYTRESIFLLRRTKRGRDLIIKLGTRFPRGWKAVGYVSVATGFIVSLFGVKMLIDNIIRAFMVRSAAPSLALLLPSPTAQPIFGYGFLAIPFWYWIICIALLALVHEGLHGVFAAMEKVKIKSLGFGILAVIPLAFVEPDEKQLEKKGVWPQLRVFSAGSFANFMLAGLTLLVIICVSNTIFTASGVDFGALGQFPYPPNQIQIQDIKGVGNHSVEGIEDIKDKLAAFGENDTIEIRTANETFFLTKSLFITQINESQAADEIIVFENFPAARSGLEGTIIKIGGYEVKDHLDLSLALEKTGPNQTITVVTEINDEEKAFSLTTVDKPSPPPFRPDEWVPFFAVLEHVIPGSVEFYYSVGGGWAGLTGQRVGITWDYIQYKAALWEWVAENYPLLQDRARGQTAYWRSLLDDHSRPGFIGITGVITHFELGAGLEPFRQPIDFIQGLLFFLFIINLGVGIVNLLPIKPLDGGKMWDAVLRKYVPKHAKRIINTVGILILLLLLSNFIPFGAFL
jgi:membrane-associated protease RseP (regulator of RpoE activity)